MSLGHSPKIVTNGLSFYYDMGNPSKSWKGAPTTNMIPDPTFTNQIWNTWAGRGENSWAYTTFGGDSTVFTDYTIDNGVSHHLFRDITVSSSLTVYALSIDVYVSPDCNATGVFMNAEYPFGNTYAGGTSYDMNAKGTWQRIYAIRDNAYNGDTGNIQTRLRYYFGAGTGTAGRIYFRNAQMEVGTFATPFVVGTRSNTQAIVDLTGNHTITASSLTYNSDGSFSFNGTNSYVDSGQNIPNVNDFTLECWVNPANSQVQYSGIMGNHGSGGTTGVYCQQQSTSLNNYTWGYGNGTSWGTGCTFSLASNQWHHLVLTKDSTYNKVYVNGSLTNTVATNGAAVNGGFNFCFGRDYASSRYFNGNISSGKLYNRALSSAEVAQNFNALRGRYGI